MRRAFAAFSLLLSLAICTVGQTAGDKSKSTGSLKDEEAIRKVLTDFVEAWNKHDAKAFSMVFAEVSRTSVCHDVQGQPPEDDGDQDQIH